MTDKQIIIDGVDVSKCIYFQQEDDEYTCGAEECNGAIVACRACDNCYYKQLKRAEAQCEAMFVSHTDLEKAYKAKEQECERLKKQLTILDDEDVVVEITVKQFEEYKKLKQTLAEIKEIAEKRNYLDYNECLDDILQKISECEVENE